MPIVGGFDPSLSGFGWAFYDTDKPLSAIESGSIKLEGDNIVEKLTVLRVNIIPLLKFWMPVSPDGKQRSIVGIEMPREFITQHPLSEGAADLISPLEPKGEQRWTQESPSNIVKGGQVAGAATMACLCWNIKCMQVAPKTWQTIIPRDIRDRFPTKVAGRKDQTAPKKRVREYCARLKIASPNVDSRDACLIAVWTAGHAQELKLLQMTGTLL